MGEGDPTKVVTGKASESAAAAVESAEGLLPTEGEDPTKAKAGRPKDEDGDGDGDKDGYPPAPDDKPAKIVEEEDDSDKGTETTDKGIKNPEETANMFSQLFFFYVAPLLKKGAKKTLEMDDLWEYAQRDDPKLLYSKFSEQLTATSNNEYPYGQLWTSLMHCNFALFSIAGITKFIWALVQFSGPLILEALLANLETGEGGYKLTIILAVSLFAASTFEMFLNNMHYHQTFRVGMHVKVASIHMVFDKLTRLSMISKSKLGSGSIANLQSNDTMKLWMLPQFLHNVWCAPFQIVVLMGLLIRILGVWPTLAGLAVTISLIPISGSLTKVMAKARREVVKLTDKRVKAVTEVITGIKAIKLYAWEEPYQKRLSDVRELELVKVKKSALLQAMNMMIFTAGPILISMAAFGVFAALGKPLTASIAFPALSLFNLLRFPIMMLPMQLMNIVNAKVAGKRLQDFLGLEESNALSEQPAAEMGQTAVAIHGGTFSWSGDAEAAPVIKDMDLEVAAGELLIVVGEVGCGKSSMLQSVLGETLKVEGEMELRGSVGYTSQDPWIQNKTMKENILYGASYDDDLYERTLMVCGLMQDLKSLPGGDETEIGEKGINLSGGQKHRVALARAVYAQADVYLLDDPLSAVDAHVGSHIFHECISGALAGTTRILVTHQLQFLPLADKIAVMEDGKISHYGSYQELIDQGVNFQQFSVSTGKDDGKPATVSEGVQEDPVAEADAQEVDGDVEAGDAASGSEEQEVETKPLPPIPAITSRQIQQNCSIGISRKEQASLRKLGSLVKAEGRAEGQVNIKLYTSYLASWGPLYILPILYFLAASCERGLQQIQNWWLSVWAVNGFAVPGSSANKDMYYVGIFFAIGCGALLAALVRCLTMVQGSVSASRRMHTTLLDKVLKLPQKFYDTQPTGRLINRFTKDIESLDVMLGPILSGFLVCAVSVIASIAVVAAVAPWFMVAVVPLGLCYWFVQHTYIMSSRELKRLDSVAFSPIFNHFTETLSGLITVRAFRKIDTFALCNIELLGRSNRCFWPLQLANRWLSVRLEFIGIVATFFTALLTAVLTPVNAGLAGLAVTSALSVTVVMNFMVRQSAELEINMNAVERVLEYEDEEEEAAAIIPSNRPAEAWPSEGVISVKGLVVKYRDDLGPVLKGISFTTEAHEKIGIAGRTGCGKSTLMMTLYRIIEPSLGSITIDGVDTLSIGLRDLRSRLALVPQDPVVFSGTIRSNLDPFSQYTDEKLWGSLKQVSMESVVTDMEGSLGLDSVISEGGNNLSVGQRQLLGLARALMRDSRILVLDEATSNIDNTTDELIQTTIRTAFTNCTVLTIAHRLHTIMNSDRIMVLDNGNLMEFDHPKQLLKNEDGLFFGLVHEASKKGLKRSKSQANTAKMIESEVERVMAMPSEKKFGHR